MEKLKTLLNGKIQEHTAIVKELTNDIGILLEKLGELKKDPSKRNDLMVTSTTMLTLKDRAMFHKAALLTLQDVLKDIEEGKV